MAQTFDEQLQRAFDTVADRLRADLKAHLATVGQELAQAVTAERADAAWQAARDAITTTEREVAARLTAEFATRETAFAAREAEAREAGYAAGVAAGQTSITEVTEQLRALEAEITVLNASFETRLAEVRNAADAKVASAAKSADDLLAEAGRAADARVQAAQDSANQRLAEALAAADARAAEAAQAADARLAEATAAADARVAAAADAAKAQTLHDLQAALDAMRALDRAASLSDALDALGQAVRAEADRVALFLVRDSGLRTWMSQGFDAETQPQQDVPLGASGVAGEAIRLRTALTARAVAPASPDGRPAFSAARPCSAVVAIPVVMHGKAVAIIYAELVAEGADPSRLTLFCELIARHAVRLLESLTVTRLAQLGTGPAAAPPGIGV